MFVQIAEALARIIDLLIKKNSAADSAKRRKIGKDLVDMHQALARIAANAREIEATLRASAGEELPDIYCRDIPSLLSVQRHLLKQLQKSLRCRDAMLQIFGADDIQHLRELVGAKISLIDIVAGLALEPAEGQEIALPLSLDLTQVSAFRAFIERYEGRLPTDYQRLASGFRRNVENPFTRRFSLERATVPQGLKDACNELAKEFADLRTSDMITSAKDDLARLLRSNFAVEELF